MPRWLLAIAALSFAAACHPPESPELRVLDAQHEVVFVQVTNPAHHPLHLTKLDYTFAAADGRTVVSRGEVPLDEREVPAGAAAVLEIPLDTTITSKKPLRLTGELFAELDQIVRSFRLSAQIQPH